MKNVLTHKYFKLCFFLLVLLILAGSFFHYNNHNERKIMGNLQGIAEESNQQINHVVSDKIEEQMHLLKAYAAIVSENELISDKTFREMDQLEKNSIFLRVAINDSQGISYTSDHNVHDSSQRPYFIEGMKGNSYISNRILSRIDQKEVVILSVPIQRGEEIIGVLRGTIDMSKLYEYFDLSFLKISSFIIQKDGLNLTKEEEGEKQNFFTMLQQDARNDSIQSKLATEMEQDKSGMISFYLNDTICYAYYSPIEGCDWYALSVLPDSIIQEQLALELQETMILAGCVAFSLLIVGLYLFYLQRIQAQELKQTNKVMDALLSYTPGTLFKYEVGNLASIVFYNQKKKIYFGYTQEELKEMITHHLFQLIYQEDFETLQKNLHENQNQNPAVNTYRILDKEQHVHWIYDQRHTIDEDGKKVYYAVVLDITEMKNTQELLKVSEARYKLILQESQSVVFEWNIHEDRIEFSDTWVTTYGYPKIMHNFLMVTYNNFKTRTNTYIPLIESMIEGKESDQIECVLPTKEGNEVWVKIFAKAIYDDQGYLLRIVGSISDISTEKQKSIQLLEQAQMDGLTKVYNRTTMESLMRKELMAFPDQIHVLFVVDIDDFKLVNDHLGHTSGDEALIQVANAMKASFRADDLLGRYGGDEFVILMRHLDEYQPEKIQQKCQKLMKEIQNIQLKKDMQTKISCSIGIAVYPKDGKTFKELFRKADEQLYQAKRLGKNRYM